MSMFKGIHTFVIIYDGEITFFKVGSPGIKHLKGMGIYKVIGREVEILQLKKDLQNNYPGAIITVYLDSDIEKPNITEFRTDYCQFCIFLDIGKSDYCEFEAIPSNQRSKFLEVEEYKKHISQCSIFKGS